MNKAQRITSVSTNDDPPSRVRFTTTHNATRPQEEECTCHCHNDEDGKLAARGIQCKCIKNCIHCRLETFQIQKPQSDSDMNVPIKQEDIFDEFDKYWFISKERTKGSTNVHRYEVKAFIHSNFIAKRDLRKLLEEVVAKFHGGGNGRRLLIELMAELKI